MTGIYRHGQYPGMCGMPDTSPVPESFFNLPGLLIPVGRVWWPPWQPLLRKGIYTEWQTGPQYELTGTIQKSTLSLPGQGGVKFAYNPVDLGACYQPCTFILPGCPLVPRAPQIVLMVKIKCGVIPAAIAAM